VSRWQPALRAAGTDGTVMGNAHRSRGDGIGEAPEHRHGLGGREGEIEPGHPGDRTSPPSREGGSVIGREAQQNGPQIGGTNLAAQTRRRGAAADPGPRSLAGSGVVLLFAFGDDAQVVLLGASHHLADGEHSLPRTLLRSVGLRSETHHGEQGGLRDHDASNQADDRQLPAGHELVGEGT